MRTILAVTALALNVLHTSAHIYFEYPKPRTCFYGGSYEGYGGTAGDGPWRQAPCTRAPIEPTVEFVSGSSVCLTLQEFVPHPGYFTIRLAETPVGPGDAEPNWHVLEARIPQSTDGTTTGHQRFMVDLPANVTCEHCTIQVSQWADDFDWYYYACTDVTILENPQPGTNKTYMEGDTCEWTPGPSRIRFKILSTIVWGSFGLFAVLLLFGWAIAVFRHKEALLPVNNVQSSSSSSSLSNDKDGMPKASFCKKARSFKRSLALVVLIIVIAVIATAVSLSSLQSC